MAEAVGIVCHPRIDIGGTPVMEARRRLEQRGYRVWTYCATAEERPGALVDTLDGTRLIVSIGGDATLPDSSMPMASSSRRRQDRPATACRWADPFSILMLGRSCTCRSTRIAFSTVRSSCRSNPGS